MRKFLLLMVGFLLVAAPARADMFTMANVCAQAYPSPSGPVLVCSGNSGFGTTDSGAGAYYDTDLDYEGSYAGHFLGYSSVTMTPDTFRLTGSIALQDYARKNRVNIDDPFVLQGMALALGSMQDSLIVGGGTGVYSLNYVLSLEGTVATDSNFYGFFCGALIMPQGNAGAVTSFCTNGGNETITLSFGNLQFNSPVTPTLQMNILTSLESLLPGDVPAFGDDLVTGNSLVDYGSTIHLQNLLITDANGNPIPGVTVQSSSGYTYTLDPRNRSAVPEPATLVLTGLGLATLLGWSKTKRRSA